MANVDPVFQVIGSVGSWLVADRFILLPLCQRLDVWSSLGAAERLRFKSYVASLVNASLLFGWSARAQFLTSSAKEDNDRGIAVARYFLGEMMYDSIVTFHLIRKRPSEFFHHVGGLVLLGALSQANVSGSQLKHALLCELSTVFMDVLWILRSMRGEQFKQTRLHSVLSVGFLLSFFATRVVWLPFVVNRARKSDKEFQQLWRNRIFRLFLCGILALQDYWFIEIAKGSYKALMKR
jgi:hypothetical protein